MGEEQKFFETTDGYVLHGRDDEVGNIYGRGLPLHVAGRATKSKFNRPINFFILT